MQAPGKIGEMIGVVVEWVATLPSQIFDALRDLGSELYNKAIEWGGKIVDGIKDSVASIPGIIADAVGVGGIAGAVGPANNIPLQPSGGSGNYHPHALGGFLDPGWNMVGEGPELVNRGTGQVIPLASGAARGAGVTIVLNGTFIGDEDGLRRAVADGLAMAV
jgi:hypothetical protein